MGELIDPGGTTEFFNPEGCVGGLGSEGCLIDPTHGFAWQGDGVAYGYRSYKAESPTVRSDDALVNVDGPVGVLAGAKDSQGVLSWVDPGAQNRPGTFGIRAGESRTWLRDFYVTRDLAEWSSELLAEDHTSGSRLKVTVKEADGSVAANARVAVFGGDGRMTTLMVTDDEGRAHADVPAGTYQLYAGRMGAAIAPPTEAVVGTTGTTEVTLSIGASRTLTVHVVDPFDVPMPAKVTVLCPTGTCPVPQDGYRRLFELERLPTNVAAVAFVPPSGVLELPLAPGAYEVVVTRGPEYSAWPDTWPNAGQPVDLTTVDQTITATLAHVVDSTGWASADLHVHAVNSADSSVANELRALSFLAEGVDVLVSTDHEYLTDYGPVVKRLGGEGVMATMVGTEISTFDFGHFNAWPVVPRDEDRGGPFDWAGGTEGATLRPPQLFAGVREQHPGALIQVNHARGSLGVLTMVQADTATFATHADPASLRMDPAPDATATDTRLLDGNFDAFEVANGLQPSTALLNDWMTMLSTGRRKTATGVSDSHFAYVTLGGYSRTYVQYPNADDVTKFDPKVFAENVKAMHAFGTNGPFLRVTARRIEAASGMPAGNAVGVGDTLSLDAAAGDKVELTVDVQTPSWIAFDQIEVYTHADGREAVNGEANTDWKPPVATKALDGANLPVEAVPGIPGSVTYNRHHVVETFTLEPEADTWYVVLVRGSSAVPTMYPLAYDSVSCDGNVCTAKAGRAYAFSNAIFVDADRSGAYDTFPEKAAAKQGAQMKERPNEALERIVPTVEELNAALRKMLWRGHGE
ncbi:MAG: carboxypeptidase regulatory-like domain-containing protein [Myxococcaceae bacterium]|nr:carboxypeptidase regulatory-like domain-containing protein [Myxococcaceae bacterium]